MADEPEALVPRPSADSLVLAATALSASAKDMRREADQLVFAEYEYRAHMLHQAATHLDRVEQWLRAQAVLGSREG